MLLQWCTLEPTGAANLAAIRFSSPVRVQSIKIFPKDAQPFAQHPEIVSRTEPQAFFLELYFNAYRVVQPNSKEKPKPTNALVPTVLAYTGGQVDFLVPMGVEYATRLMIVRGTYECVSMAIYGDIMAELPPPPMMYEPRQLPSIEPFPISRALDPFNSLDPSALARQLLNLIPDAPPLPLAICLVFCLKPPSDDWDLPEFPYLHPDLDSEADEFDLEKASRLTSRPVADDVQDETLLRFAENVARSIGPKDSSQSYLIAGILAHSASQNPKMAKYLLDELDLAQIFDPSNMDELTLLRMGDAAANPDIARYLDNSWFLDLVNTIAKNPNAEKGTQEACSQLISRIKSWVILEDTLSNTQGDFNAAAQMIKDMGTDEQTLGVWLESMITHEDIVAALSENPIMPIPLPHPPYLFGSLKPSISHDEFVAFVRAVIGVASVLAVYAFADAYPHKLCRERSLSIIRLWQGVDGYREIVNHLLLLKQMIFRLECMMDNDLPRRAGLDAEYILVNLSKNPQAILQPDLIRCILGLRPPHAFITEDERISMRQAALVADDGLAGAIDELLRPLEHPLTLTDLRTLRVALAVIDQELHQQQEFNVLQEFWQEGSIGLVTHLVDVLVPIADEIKDQFGLKPPEHRPQELMEQLFRTSDDLTKLLLRLLPAYPLPSRTASDLTASIADLFVCTDAADMLYSQSSPTCVAAQETRQSYIEVIRTLASPVAPSEGSKLGAEVVLCTLLQHGLRSQDRDPVHHLLQVFCLIDHLLPMPDSKEDRQSIWTQRVIPLLLQELWAFCRVLDVENKAHFVRRLITLDGGLVGVGDWLLLEELKELLHALELLENPSLQLHERVMRQTQVSMSLRFMLDLTGGSSYTSTLCVDCLLTVHEASSILAKCLTSMYDQHLTSSALTELVQILASEPSRIDQDLRIALASTLLRSAQISELPEEVLPGLLEQCVSIVSISPPVDVLVNNIQVEFTPLLASLHNSSRPCDTATAEQYTVLLGWLVDTSPASAIVFRGISEATFTAACDLIRNALSSGWRERLDTLRSKISVVEETSPAIASIPLPDTVVLAIHDIEELLRSQIPPPSTPVRKALNQDVLGLVTISPPTLIRSPTVTGLTKTYNNNDFRQLRQTPTARQNTSRLPSMHVDEFESASSPTLVSVPIPAATLPFPAEGFQPLAPPFNPL